MHCALQFARVSQGDMVDAAPFAPPTDNFQIVLMQAEISIAGSRMAKPPPLEFEAGNISQHLISRFVGQVSRLRLLTAGCVNA